MCKHLQTAASSLRPHPASRAPDGVPPSPSLGCLLLLTFFQMHWFKGPAPQFSSSRSNPGGLALSRCTHHYESVISPDFLFESLIFFKLCRALRVTFASFTSTCDEEKLLLTMTWLCQSVMRTLPRLHLSCILCLSSNHHSKRSLPLLLRLSSVNSAEPGTV